MASEYTQNLHLDKYASTDRPNLRDQYNSSMDKIDTAVHSIQTQQETANLTIARLDTEMQSTTIKATSAYDNMSAMGIDTTAEAKNFADRVDEATAATENLKALGADTTDAAAELANNIARNTEIRSLVETRPYLQDRSGRIVTDSSVSQYHANLYALVPPSGNDAYILSFMAALKNTTIEPNGDLKIFTINNMKIPDLGYPTVITNRTFHNLDLPVMFYDKNGNVEFVLHNWGSSAITLNEDSIYINVSFRANRS